MKISTILRKAARRIGPDTSTIMDEFSCNAVQSVERTAGCEDASPAWVFYNELMAPSEDQFGHLRLRPEDFVPEAKYINQHGRPTEEQMSHRVLALLFAAEVAASEGL